jgi:hypothetical protein
VSREQYRNGDEMVKGSETGRIQMRQNRETREYFPVVVILSGPRTGQSEYVSRGWRRADERAHYDRPEHDDDALTTTERKWVRKILGKR